MRGFAPILIVTALLATVPLITSVQRRAQFPGGRAADRAGRPGLEPARRLWRPVFVRPRRLLRHRRLCDRHPAGALRHQRVARPVASASPRAPLVGAVIGALSFRSGLRGSYFALVTLAFAEVLRIIASVAPITGAGVGTLIKLDLRPEAFQFQSRAPFYWIILALVGVVAGARPDDRGSAASARGWSPCAKTRMPRRRSASNATMVKLVRDDHLGRDHRGRPAASTRSISCSSMPASPMGPGSRSRRCSRRSSAASAPSSARCSARWWSRRSESSPSS